MRMNTSKCWPLLAATLLAACHSSAAGTGQQSPPAPVPALAQDPLDALVADVCNKEVVLLGEDGNHGGGRTLEVKSALVQRLVKTCGFKAVFFKSQLYDVIDFNRALAAGTATEAKLADAVGALWSRWREAQPLFAFLYNETQHGRVQVAGLDPQVGGATGYFSQQRLADELAAYLPAAQRTACAAEINRHNRWEYDDAQPFDAAAQTRLRNCAEKIQTAVAGSARSPMQAQASVMAAAYLRYLDMALANHDAAREQGMRDNFLWHQARLPPGSKIIVWTATVHAAKTLAGISSTGPVPLGEYLHQQFGERAAVIGFSALSGGYRQPNRHTVALPAAPPASLEARTLTDPAARLRYVDGPQLAALGAIQARPINYGRWDTAVWSNILDGLIVLREERAVQPVAPPVPPAAGQ
jgi:erythromycin esterase-like protein